MFLKILKINLDWFFNHTEKIKIRKKRLLFKKYFCSFKNPYE